jgi:hypothetical protein
MILERLPNRSNGGGFGGVGFFVRCEVWADGSEFRFELRTLLPAGAMKRPGLQQAERIALIASMAADGVAQAEQCEQVGKVKARNSDSPGTTPAAIHFFLDSFVPRQAGPAGDRASDAAFRLWAERGEERWRELKDADVKF